MSGRAPYLNARLQGLGTTVFATMSALAEATGSVNLGQGFPDYDGPPEVLEAARHAIAMGHNQYPPGRGVLALRQAVAEHQQRHYGLQFDPSSEVLITAGATEALAATVLSLCEVGDEVICFEPYYDVYPAVAALAGARHRVVKLTAPSWTFSEDELRGAITPRSKLLIVNSPHNPTGKVFTQTELEAIASICIEHDLIAVTDEVYEHLVFSGRHLPLATLEGMAERTITISSSAKTFSVTGWKIGWVCAPKALIDAVMTAKQFLTFSSGTPFQHAVAVGLGLDQTMASSCARLKETAALLCQGLDALGLEVFLPNAGYFVITDISSITSEDANSFCMSLPDRCGVVAIPAEAFYDNQREARFFVRWAFCKTQATIEEALGRLATLTD